jgi:hypothetical protein
VGFGLLGTGAQGDEKKGREQGQILHLEFLRLSEPSKNVAYLSDPH